MWKKEYALGAQATKKFLNGVNFVDAMCGDTLGPAGRNRIFQEKYRPPQIINDGSEIARKIVLDDEIEDLAAQTLIEVSMRTSERAGDGSTTSIVVGAELYRNCLEKLQESTDLSKDKVTPMSLTKRIREEEKEAQEILKSLAKDVTDKDIDNVISTSIENHEFGKELGELIRQVGTDGYIDVQDNWATKYGIDTELTTGMKFLGKLASPYLANDASQKDAIWEDTYVLVCNHKIDSIQAIQNVVKEIMDKGYRKLVLINGYSTGENPYDKTFVASVAKAILQVAKGGDAMQILAIRAQSLTTPELEDVSSYCGATFLDTNLGNDISQASIQHLGFAAKVVVSEDEVHIMGGVGDPKERIKTLKEQMEKERDAMFKEKIKRRIASLSSAQGVIRVGASTESERRYLKEKIKDAVNAARAALEEGIVKGGGQALKEVAEKLGKDSLLYNALNAPYKRIRDNGHTDKIPKTVVDPQKVVRMALENACSGAGMLISSDGGIAEHKLTYGEWIEKAFKNVLASMDDKHDFRDDEVQDKGVSGVI